MRIVETSRKFIMSFFNDDCTFFVYHNHFNWHILSISCEGLFRNYSLPKDEFEVLENGLYIEPSCDVV